MEPCVLNTDMESPKIQLKVCTFNLIILILQTSDVNLQITFYSPIASYAFFILTSSVNSGTKIAKKCNLSGDHW
jgi:hypothetical protein